MQARLLLTQALLSQARYCNNDGIGNTSVIMNTGSSVNGGILLSDGDDSVMLAGGDFSAITQVDGGNGNDTVIFKGSNGYLTNQFFLVLMQSLSIV